ncbi:hypothetical protein [Erwinia phage phiEaP8]|uniref:Uncharacterized protein n=1 Tax=Erwinia phage phiEaP8 TaxID=2178928 RepID=A0A3G1QTT2_9CAUD|nr:hypothetical protein HYP64_gp26 [Erwinia phage phiEaP8]AWN06266.1 hypothetical protein [Erwinia phage phiEaP8]
MFRLILILIGIFLNTYTNVHAAGNVLIGIALFGYFIQYFPYAKSKEDITYHKVK